MKKLEGNKINSHADSIKRLGSPGPLLAGRNAPRGWRVLGSPRCHFLATVTDGFSRDLGEDQCGGRAAGGWDLLGTWLLQLGEDKGVAWTSACGEMASLQHTQSRARPCHPGPPRPTTLQQALEVELSLLVQLLHARRAAGSQEDVHGLLP